MIRKTLCTIILCFFSTVSRAESDLVPVETCYIKTEIKWPQDDYGQPIHNKAAWDRIFDGLGEILNETPYHVAWVDFLMDQVVIAHELDCDEAYEESLQILEEYENHLWFFQKWNAPKLVTERAPFIPVEGTGVFQSSE